MATNIRRKVRKLKVSGELPCENDLEYILHGYNMLDGDEPTDTPENLWARWCKTIMQLQGQPCGDLVPWHGHRKTFFDYFTRPPLWWSCRPGSEEPRKLISGDAEQVITAKGYSHGLPRWFKTEQHGCIFETEKEYLIRHPELMTSAEKLLVEQNKT